MQRPRRCLETPGRDTAEGAAHIARAAFRTAGRDRQRHGAQAGTILHRQGLIRGSRIDWPRAPARATPAAVFPERAMSPAVFLTGLVMGLGLIVAIGAQNAFVLRQGLRGEHVLAVVLACALSDAALIVAGVVAFRQIAATMDWLGPWMRWGGAAFLVWCGARSLRAALTGTGGLKPAGGRAAGLGATLATCLALTWLNPHVYLDTVALLGAVSTRFPGDEAAFALGAATASVLFFFALGYGAAGLRPLLARPGAWRVLEAAIAAVMWGIAARLALGG